MSLVIANLKVGSGCFSVMTFYGQSADVSL